MNTPTETITMQDGTQYTIKTRLGWGEQQRCDAAGFKMVVDGHRVGSLADVKDINDIEEIQIVMTPDLQNTMRLQCRLTSHTPRQVPSLPTAHVNKLIARIVALEAEEKAELAALDAGDAIEGKEPGPLGKRLLDSATPASS